VNKKIAYAYTILAFFLCGNLLFNPLSIAKFVKNSSVTNLCVSNTKTTHFETATLIKSNIDFASPFDIDVEDEDVENDHIAFKITKSQYESKDILEVCEKKKSYNTTAFCQLQTNTPLYELFCSWKHHLS